MVPIMQECVDAITEHQRLHALMKGEWAKGLLPHNTVREDYTVQRIQGNWKLKSVVIPVIFMPLHSVMEQILWHPKILLRYNHSYKS